MPCKKDFQEINQVAYNSKIRYKLKDIHQLLGGEITDVASAGMQVGRSIIEKAEELREQISSLTSELTVALIELRGNEADFNKEEVEDFRNIKRITDQLGNLQFSLNHLIKKIKTYNEAADEVQEVGMDLGEQIMDSQELFRKVRADMNAFGLLSKDPETAVVFDALEE